MSNESKLDRKIRRWNKFFTIFGLCAANLENETLRDILRQPALIAIFICTLNFVQFTTTDTDWADLDEDGVVRCVHMFGNFIMIFQVLLTLSKIKRCSNIQRKFQLLERYGTCDLGDMITGYLVFPVINLVFFASMDIAEYVFLQPEVRPVDVVPIISGHILILYNILYVLHFSVHLSWLRRLIALMNFELSRVATHLYRMLKSEDKNGFLTISPQSEETNDGERTEILDIVNEIKLCRYLHNECYILGREINETFATRNLIAVSFNVVVGIVFLAPAVSDIITVVTSDADTSLEVGITAEHIMFHCKWSVTCFFTVYGLIWASKLTISEICHASNLVYDMLEIRLNAKVKSELHRFAVQLLQSKMEFTAHDFFTLNNQLFVSILATLFSYIFVMIQLNV